MGLYRGCFAVLLFTVLLLLGRCMKFTSVAWPQIVSAVFTAIDIYLLAAASQPAHRLLLSTLPLVEKSAGRAEV